MEKYIITDWHYYNGAAVKYSYKNLGKEIDDMINQSNKKRGYSLECAQKYVNAGDVFTYCGVMPEPIQEYVDGKYTDRILANKVYVMQNTHNSKQNPICVKVMQSNLPELQFGQKLAFDNLVACEFFSDRRKDVFFKADNLHLKEEK